MRRERHELVLASISAALLQPHHAAACFLLRGMNASTTCTMPPLFEFSFLAAATEQLRELRPFHSNAYRSGLNRVRRWSRSSFATATWQRWPTFMTFLYRRPASPLDFICRQTNLSRAIENRDRTEWRMRHVCASCCLGTARPFGGMDVEKVHALGRAARRPSDC